MTAFPSVVQVLLWGFVATLLLTGIMAGAQGLGQSRMSVPYLLGSAFTTDRTKALRGGVVLHFVAGWLFTGVYALGFWSLGTAGWGVGALAGLLHGVSVLTVVLPLFPAFHPHMATERHGPTPTRWLQPPGFLGLNYGRRTPLVALLAHTVYGTVLGGGMGTSLLRITGAG
jgi:hypothetical protein